MNKENLIPTTAEEYRKKHSTTTLVKLPSGAVFEIRKLTPEWYIENEGSVVSGVDNITDREERKKIVAEKLQAKYDNMSDDERREHLRKQNILYKKIIVHASVNPKVSMTEEEGKLHIDEITSTPNFYPLVKAISDYSGGEDLKPFRT